MRIPENIIYVAWVDCPKTGICLHVSYDSLRPDDVLKDCISSLSVQRVTCGSIAELCVAMALMEEPHRSKKMSLISSLRLSDLMLLAVALDDHGVSVKYVDAGVMSPSDADIMEERLLNVLLTDAMWIWCTTV